MNLQQFRYLREAVRQKIACAAGGIVFTGLGSAAERGFASGNDSLD